MMIDGDNHTLNGAPNNGWSHDTMPFFPRDLPWWRRILCVLGYHAPAEWRCYGPKRRPEGMRLRDLCLHCRVRL